MAEIHLHPNLTAAQAQHVMRSLNARLSQDMRGNVRLMLPVATFQQCDKCTSTICAELGLCARPTPEPEAA